MSESRSPLARLVLFLICLSIAGGLIGGAHYLAIDRPVQRASELQAPANEQSAYMDCVYVCIHKYTGKNMDEVQACSRNCLNEDFVRHGLPPT